MSEDDVYAGLDQAIIPALTPWANSETPVTLLFSGGVDSGLLGWELRQRKALQLVTIGTAGSPDLRVAREAAALLGLPGLSVEVTVSDLRAVVERIRPHVDELSPTARSVLTAFALALEHAPSRDILCGQGADELFLGYAHFRGLNAEDARSRSASDLRLLLEQDWPRAQAIAREFGHRAVAPYLAPEFVDAALRIPVEARLPQGSPKSFFRGWASHRGLPAPIALRPKRAFQFGSGIDRLIRSARDRGGPGS